MSCSEHKGHSDESNLTGINVALILQLTPTRYPKQVYQSSTEPLPDIHAWTKEYTCRSQVPAHMLHKHSLPINTQQQVLPLPPLREVCCDRTHRKRQRGLHFQKSKEIILILLSKKVSLHTYISHLWDTSLHDQPYLGFLKVTKKNKKPNMCLCAERGIKHIENHLAAISTLKRFCQNRAFWHFRKILTFIGSCHSN